MFFTKYSGGNIQSLYILKSYKMHQGKKQLLIQWLKILKLWHINNC